MSVLKSVHTLICHLHPLSEWSTSPLLSPGNNPSHLTLYLWVTQPGATWLSHNAALHQSSEGEKPHFPQQVTTLHTTWQGNEKVRGSSSFILKWLKLIQSNILMMIKQCGNGTWDDCTTVSLNVKSVHGLRGPELGVRGEGPGGLPAASRPPRHHTALRGRLGSWVLGAALPHHCCWVVGCAARLGCSQCFHRIYESVPHKEFVCLRKPWDVYNNSFTDTPLHWHSLAFKHTSAARQTLSKKNSVAVFIEKISTLK